MVDSLPDPGQADMVRVEVLIVGAHRRHLLERRLHCPLPNWNGKLRLTPGLPLLPALRVARDDPTRGREDLKPVKRQMRGLHRRRMIGPLLEAAIQLLEVVHRRQMLGLLLPEPRTRGLLP